MTKDEADMQYELDICRLLDDRKAMKKVIDAARRFVQSNRYAQFIAWEELDSGTSDLEKALKELDQKRD